MNNCQELRSEVEQLFFAMGGPELERDTAVILEDLQISLNDTLNDLVSMLAIR